MAGELAGRTAIVTGASRGIGFAVATALVQGGARVVMTSRTAESAEAAAAELDTEFAVGYAAHAADEDAAAGCVAFALERFGSVDILVNNAGINPAFGPAGRPGPRALRQDGRHQRVGADPLDPARLARVDGASTAGPSSTPPRSPGSTVSPNLGIYHVTKAALIHLTRQLALELAPQVRVNAVAPGIVRTRSRRCCGATARSEVAGLSPLGRIGVPADVGGAVAFLASDQASWITGETLVIDGGQLLHLAQAEAERRHERDRVVGLEPERRGASGSSASDWAREAPLRFARVGNGKSNLTYLVTDAAGARWILRRAPVGPRLATAHDVAREARVLRALEATPVPAPAVLGFTDDAAVSDAPLLLMTFVDGVVDDPERLDPPRARD